MVKVVWVGRMALHGHCRSPIIGPSGCGKSTFLRTLNRMNDLIEGARLEGSIKFGDEEINHQHCDVVELRRRIGMVFQRPTPFAKSIFENVVYGLKVSRSEEHTSELQSHA